MTVSQWQQASQTTTSTTAPRRHATSEPPHAASSAELPPAALTVHIRHHHPSGAESPLLLAPCLNYHPSVCRRCSSVSSSGRLAVRPWAGWFHHSSRSFNGNLLTHWLAGGGGPGRSKALECPMLTLPTHVISSVLTVPALAPGSLTLAVGDFNSLPGSLGMRTLRSVGGLTDAWAATHTSSALDGPGGRAAGPPATFGAPVPPCPARLPVCRSLAAAADIPALLPVLSRCALYCPLACLQRNTFHDPTQMLATRVDYVLHRTAAATTVSKEERRSRRRDCHSFCDRPIDVAIATTTTGRGGCSRMRISPTASSGCWNPARFGTSRARLLVELPRPSRIMRPSKPCSFWRPPRHRSWALRMRHQ